MIRSIVMLLGILAGTAIALFTYKKSPWVIVCMLHSIVFVSVDLMRFITFKDRLDYFFIRYEFFDFAMAMISITSILNRNNNKWVHCINILCHYIVIVIVARNRDAWMSLYLFTDMITIITSMMIRDIDKRILYDKIVKEIKQELICYACKKIKKTITLDKITKMLIQSLSVEAFIRNTRDLITYMTTESETSMLEYLQEMKNLLTLIKDWTAGIKPPIEVQYFLTGIGKFPILCSAWITFLFIDPYMTDETLFVVLLLICGENYYLYKNFELSTDYLIKSQEHVSDKLDTVITKIDIVKNGLDAINVTIETMTNGVKSTIKITTDFSCSIYSNFISGAQNVIEYSRKHPYKVGLIGLIPIIGVAGYLGYKRRNSDDENV